MTEKQQVSALLAEEKARHYELQVKELCHQLNGAKSDIQQKQRENDALV